MKRSLFLLVIAIASSGPALAGTTAPPIDTAALAAYARGNGTISGSVRFLGGVQAVCAPAIPYVAWYVEKLKTAPALTYDRQMIPFTHIVQIRKDRTFMCEGLAPGGYLVWVEGYTRGFPQSTIESRWLDDPISGQMLQTHDTATVAIGGADPQQSVVGPQQVFVEATGTTNVTL